MSTNREDGRTDEPTVAEQLQEAGRAPEPGHPATADPTLPSSGEQLSRGGEEMAVPGDDVVTRAPRDDADER